MIIVLLFRADGEIARGLGNPSTIEPTPIADDACVDFQMALHYPNVSLIF
jgi:hypothetical protein